MNNETEVSFMEKLIHPINYFVMKSLTDQDDSISIESYSSQEQFINDVRVITSESNPYFHRPTYKVSLRRERVIINLAEPISRENLRELLEKLLSESEIPGELKILSGEKEFYFIRMHNLNKKKRTNVFVEKKWNSVYHPLSGGL